MRKKGFTLIELLVVIAIIAMLLAILMPALSKVKKIAQRVVCGTNLKGLGTAQTVYANDYEDRYTVQIYNRGRILGDRTANWADPVPDWTANAALSIGASLYLLVREADVSPKSFVCPSGAETVFDGKNPNNYDVTELWDFGHPGQGTGPVNCQSYAYQMPYCRYAADGSRGASFAMMADKNPYFDGKLGYVTGTAPNSQSIGDNAYDLFPDWPTPNNPNPPAAQKHEIQGANSQPHGREGQNVVFGDGHNSFEKRPDVAVNHDNIYTIWATATNPGPSHMRRGAVPPQAPGTAFQSTANPGGTGIEPLGQNDTVLVNDSRRR